jgi:hypothetical protein
MPDLVPGIHALLKLADRGFKLVLMVVLNTPTHSERARNDDPARFQGNPHLPPHRRRHELTTLIKQNLYGGGSKPEGQAALIARNRLDDFVFQITDDALPKGNVADLIPLKRAIIIETHTEWLEILSDYSRRFGRGGKAVKKGMLAILSDPDVSGRFNVDHQASIRAIAAGTSFLAKRRLHQLDVSIRTEAGKFV